MKRALTLRPIGFALSRIIVSALCVATAMGLFAQTFTTIVTFNGTDGRSPGYGPLVQGRDGNLYGTTEIGGLYDAGTLFQLDPVTETLTTIYNFCSQTNCTDGASPAAGVILGTDGNFYGTTMAGGDLNCDPQVGCGTVFKMTSKGVLTTLYTFTGNGDGFTPVAPLVQASDGKFYGTTGLEAATVFRVTSSGKFKTLHLFQYPEGNSLYGGLIQASDGNFYGTSNIGGKGSDPHCTSDGCGTVFKVTPRGKLTTLYGFDFTDGAFPVAGLLQASDGSLYGTTGWGGMNQINCLLVYPGSQCGTLFQMVSYSTLNTLYNFCAQPSCTDGIGSFGTLIQATDGNFYGTTVLGGVYDDGTIFVFNPTTYALNTLHSFGDGTDGIFPYAGLLQATNGKFYGTTDGGGSGSYYGTIFCLDGGLVPFVQAMTYSGKVGATIEFLGQGFTKSSTVFFNGTPATPTVKSGTYLTVRVPAGATTGPVTITTSMGTLQSNKIFRVIP